MADRKWWTLTVVGVATFMLLLDVTIVNVALPDIQRSIGATFSDLQWVVDAYALTLAVTLLVSGSLADLVGRRAIFVGGLLVFSLSSLVCGLASGPLMLSISRAVQGVGGAMMFATTLALVAQVFQGEQRAVAFGVLGAVTGGAVAIGPLLGGALTDGLGWRSIFLVNVPVGAVAVALTLRFVRESRDPGTGGIDWAGAVAFSASMFLLVLGLIRANADGWASPLILFCLCGSAALMCGFVAVELRRRSPLFELALFRKRAFCGVSSTAFVLSGAMFSMFLYITLYLQNILGLSPLNAGLALLPVTLLSFIVSPIAGRLSARVPARVFLSSGLLLVAVGLLVNARLDVGATWKVLLPGFVLGGIGIGLINPPLASAAIAVVPPQRSGMASGINSTFRQVGLATGVAALGAVFQSSVQSKIVANLSGTALAAHASAIGRAVATGGGRPVLSGSPAGVEARVTQAAHQAFTSGINELFVIGGVIALLGAIVAAVLTRSADFVTQSRPEQVAVSA